MSGPRKIFANQQERKAFFTRLQMQKQPPQYAALPAGNPWMGQPIPFYYVQQPFQPTQPTMGQPWPIQQQQQWQGIGQWPMSQAWPNHPPWQSAGPPPKSQAWPIYPPCHSAGPPPTSQTWPNYPSWQSPGPPPMSQTWPTQPVYPYPMQFQEPSLVNEQALRDFHGSLQYNTEQSPQQIQGLFMMPQAQPSGYVQPISHVPSYSPQAQSQFHAEISVTGVQDTIPVSNLKRKASTEMAKEAKKASGDTHAMQSEHQNLVMNDASGSQRPAENTAEPQRNTNGMQPKHQSLVINDATEVQRLTESAAEPQQNTHTTQSKPQSPFVNDVSKSQRTEQSAVEPSEKTDPPAHSGTASSEKLEPQVLPGREHKAAIKTFIDQGKTSAHHTSKLHSSSAVTTTIASSTIAANQDNTTTDAKTQSKQFSHPNSPCKVEESLRREHREVRKTFRDYNFENVLFGKAARYKFVINIDQIDLFTKMQSYSAESFAIYRCVMDIPKSFIFVVPSETHSDQDITKDTTDVVWVYHANGNHWVMVHLSLKHWRLFYYDSMLYKQGPADRKLVMENWCGKAIDDIRKRPRTKDVSLQECDPEMDWAYNILQNDDHSCGPFALREIEKLIGIPVEMDLDDPVRIRFRHLATIHQGMKHHMMNKDPDGPAEHLELTFMEERRAHEDKRRIEAIIKAASSLEASTTTPNPSPSSDACTPTLTKQETSISADLAEIPMISSSQATTRCLSPELEYRNFCLKASKGENRMSRNNPYLSNSLLDESLHEPPVSDVSAGLAPPTDLLGQTDDSEEIEDDFINSDQDFVVNKHQAMSEKRISRILQGLASTLKVAGEMPKRRPKPSYAYEDPDPLNDSQAMGEM